MVLWKLGANKNDKDVDVVSGLCFAPLEFGFVRIGFHNRQNTQECRTGVRASIIDFATFTVTITTHVAALPRDDA